jgi:SH3 domain protein
MLKRRTLAALGVTAAACFMAPAAAQTAYVTDSLRLGLHHAEDTSDRPFENLVSGTALEVLERNANYAHVRTPGGQEGWVKSAYLVEQKPAALRVAELESELASVRGEVDQVRNARSTAEEELHRLGKQVAATTGSSDAIQEALGRLKRENEAYEARLDSYRGSLPLPWVGAALVVTLVAGFVAGLWWLDALIRRRHGGFRIY